VGLESELFVGACGLVPVVVVPQWVWFYLGVFLFFVCGVGWLDFVDYCCLFGWWVGGIGEPVFGNEGPLRGFLWLVV